MRNLAREGRLAGYVTVVECAERRRLRAAVHEIVQPVVFQQLTRKLELKRGHPRCAVSVSRLEDSCLDRFHDDMDAVIEDVFQYARMPIHNLEGWVQRRLTAATVNGYRRRRGARGALQRPRVPRWLASRLGGCPRLTDLALDILEFVGNDICAGARVWPTERWAERRSVADGDYEAAHRAVVCDVETVLAAMRTKPAWYESYVERPLGRKPPAVVPLSAEDIRVDTDGPLVELASLAVTAIRTRVARGENPVSVVVDVVPTVFCLSDEVAPGVDELVAVRLADRAAVERIAATVLN
ncbi:hypothetical protein EV192_111117 [Actinocrispum wychmicini]|uniref:Uncharacterized protein n=1 Tax=Actinocrispum wychmicini TaxID=1213861 RepID=A0A4R2J3B8_9PSEU|nr:hypothetical protein EV192_111117 [Actinocrispum wychmicini]